MSDEDVEVFGFGARVSPGIDFSEQEGTIIQLPLMLEGRTVSATVVTSGSEVKKQGIRPGISDLSRVRSIVEKGPPTRDRHI